MIAFSHIPRTGGTSLRQFIRDSLPEGSRHAFVDSFAHFAFMTDGDLASLDFLATHCGYGIFRRLPPSVTKVSTPNGCNVCPERSYRNRRSNPFPHPSSRIGITHVHDWKLVDEKTIAWSTIVKDKSGKVLEDTKGKAFKQ
jgi:hypothetical protein